MNIVRVVVELNLVWDALLFYDEVRIEIDGIGVVVAVDKQVGDPTVIEAD